MPLHICDLSENGEDQLPDAPSNWAQAVDVNGNPQLDEATNRALNVKCIATKTIDGIYMDGVTRPSFREKSRKPRP
jgi:hypothetical protein